MEFSVTALNEMEENLNSTLCSILKETRVQTVEDLNPTVLANKLNKNTLAKMVVDLAILMHNNISVCKSAAAKIDELKSRVLVDQKTVIECQQKQLESVKTAVKTEIRSWSDIVRTNVSQAPSPTTEVIKNVVRNTVEQSDRNRSFIIYGAAEDEEKTPENILTDVFFDLNKQVDSVQRPKVVAVRRIGIQKPDASFARPIKVTLTNPDEVKSVLSRSNLLKKSPEEYFRKLYLAPDRTLEERREHQKLVCEVKRRIESEPEKYHYIKNKRVLSVDRTLSASDNNRGSE
ncbi:hypothetical protein ACHWQZ_G015934 [Mnemiopsis leidyi]